MSQKTIEALLAVKKLNGYTPAVDPDEEWVVGERVTFLQTEIDTEGILPRNIRLQKGMTGTVIGIEIVSDAMYEASGYNGMLCDGEEILEVLWDNGFQCKIFPCGGDEIEDIR